MSRKWEYVTLRDIATDIRDGTHGTHPRVLNGVPFLSAKNIGKNGKLNWGHSDEFVTENEYRLITATFSPMPGDLLITVVGTLGRTTIFNGEKVAFQRSVAFVRPTKEITVDYLFQVSKTSGFSRQMEQRSNATAQAGLYLGELAKIQIPLPGISFQRKIAAILATTDQAIEKTEALIHKYQQIKAGLMHDLFTRGLTTDGKLRLPREQAPELYQETPIGWIPKEWELLKASDICYPVTKGTTPSYFNYSTDEGSVPYLRVENLSFNGSLQFDQDSLFVSKIIHNTELIRSKIYTGDIIMNIVGPPLGKVSLVPNDYEEWNTNQAVAIYRVLHKKYTEYLLYYLLSGFAQKWFYVRSKQTSGQVNLTLEMCSNLEIPIPKNEKELLNISNSITQIFEKIAIDNDCLVKLKKQKLGLMHDLLNGKVQVKIDQAETAHV